MLSQFLEAPRLQQNHISSPQRLKFNAKRILSHLNHNLCFLIYLLFPCSAFSQQAGGLRDVCDEPEMLNVPKGMFARGWSRVSELPLSLGLFSDLDTHSHLGVITYGVSMTTLEDVYLKLEVEAEIDQAGGKEGAGLCPWVPSALGWSQFLWNCHCQEEGTRKTSPPASGGP